MSAPNENESSIQGNSIDPYRDDASNPGSDSATAGSDVTGNGSHTVGSDSNRGKGKWAAIALALATVVYVLAELVGIATGNKDRFEDLQQDVNRELPSVGTELDKLQEAVNNLKEQVLTIPTEPPTAPPTEIVVTPGKDGAPGKTIVIPPASNPAPSPQPTRTVIVTPPPCNVALFNECISR